YRPLSVSPQAQTTMQWPIEARRYFNLTRAWIAVQNPHCIFSHGLLAKKSFSPYPEEEREGSEYCRERWRRARSAERSSSAGAGLGAPRRPRRRQRATIAAPRSARLGPD